MDDYLCLPSLHKESGALLIDMDVEAPGP